MATNDNGNGNPPPPTGGNAPPIKPWERAPPSTNGPTPFRPSSAGGTSDVVEASGTAKPGEIVSAVTTNTSTVVPRPPPRPWEQQNTYGNSGYGSGMYNSGMTGYGSGMYNSGMTGYGSSMYGGSYGGLYGNNMYRGGMYGGAYGSSMYGGGMYGGGMYGGGAYGGGAYGGGMYGGGAGMSGPYGNNQDPNDPYGSPAKPPGFWISLLRVLEGVVNFFGRISILIDQNTHALSNFMMAMLQLFDRSGILYGELARFVLRLLGVKSKPMRQVGPPGQLPGPDGQVRPQLIEGPKALSGWDNAWDADASKPTLSG